MFKGIIRLIWLLLFFTLVTGLSKIYTVIKMEPRCKKEYETNKNDLSYECYKYIMK